MTRIKGIWQRMRVMFGATVIWGLLAHAYMLFNKISIHDDSYSLFSLGASFRQGRWMLGILNRVTKIFGGPVSLPWLNGILSILCLTVSACLIADYLEITKVSFQIAIGGGMVTFPWVASLFGFMFTAWPYALGILVATVAVLLLLEHEGGTRWKILAACAISACVGIYQPIFGYAVALAVVLMLLTKEQDGKNRMIRSLFLFGALLISLVLYLGIDRIVLLLMHETKYGAAGIAENGTTSLGGYITRLGVAYREFLFPTATAQTNVFQLTALYGYYVLVYGGFLLSVLLAVKRLRKDVLDGLCSLVLILLLPMAMNLIYVLAPKEALYALTMCGQFALWIWWIGLLGSIRWKWEAIGRVISGVVVSVVIFLNAFFVKYDNTCYLKAEFLQSRAMSYYTTLATRIVSLEGYRDTMGMIFLNRGSQNSLNLEVTKEFQNIRLKPYEWDTAISDYTWEEFMAEWCGFHPYMVFSEENSSFAQMEEVQNMPHYPDDGSVRIIEGVVVVNF